MYRRGIVEALNAPQARVRVRFPDADNMVSWWLEVLQQRTLADRSYWLPEVGEHVAVLMDEHDEAGVVIGALYSTADPPPARRETLERTVYQDGTVVEYDRNRSRLLIDCVGHVEIRGRTVTIHADERLWVDCAGSGYRLVSGGGGVHRTEWKPDLSDTRPRQSPEIDGRLKTGKRSD